MYSTVTWQFWYLLLLCVVRMRVVCDYRWYGCECE